MPLDQQHEIERQQNERGEMSFFEHIAELRKHILRAVMAIAIVGIVAFLNKDFVFNTLIFGPRHADFPTYRALCNVSHAVGLGDNMCFTPPKFEIITRQLGEVLMQHLYVSFWMGVIGAFPFIFWEFWKFISPGLYEKERQAVRGVVAICSLLFLLGVAFGYFVIAPFSISFLAGYTLEGLEVSPTLDSYVTYMTMFTLPTGLIFEMPIVAYFLAKIGLVGTTFLRSYRRHAIVVILIIAAIITPPDVVSQTLVAIPLYLLYEISIMVVAGVQRRRDRALKLEESRSRAVAQGE
ncbi:MAG: twin-arginine translocase subunit TatC [Haliscomenobacteraceae bacterium CHB4]|nr:Sec-independent protein translocase protein TatCy [Saprospiraceae bacterium]MCE7922602.1 twin-arginine translocase subunit TatC [Haliscomenobacteraceae bacterium CHB4]